MDTAIKLTLLFLVVLFLINNAKAGKPVNEEDNLDGYSFSSESEYNLALHEK